MGRISFYGASYGSISDINPSVVRAELKAVLEALRIAVPPLRLHIDNGEVVQGWINGKTWCVDPSRDGAELWASIWRILDDIGDGVEFVKVKAHTDEDDVERGIISTRDRLGNSLADRFARQGARLGEALSSTKQVRAELTKAVRWYYWARRVAAIWAKDIGDDAREASGYVAAGGWQGAGGGSTRGTGVRHLVWEKGGNLLCRRCGRLADTAQKRRRMQSSRCLGSAAGRLLARACGDTEAVSRQCVYGYLDLLNRGWCTRSAEDRDPRAPNDDGGLFGEG